MKPSSTGFTLIEVIIAMSILSVSLLGLALTIPVAIQANNRNRVDAEGVMLAQRELEQMVAQPLTAASFTDDSGNSVSLAAGGSPLVDGRISFTAPAVSGYNAIVTGNSGARYELRWNVQALADSAKQFTIATRRSPAQRYLLPPVNLWARQGR